jgi:hypothetical protein
MSNWIDFVEGPPNTKTRTWRVVTKDGATTLGQVSWIARWRCYGLYPAANTVFEQDCLRSIASFIEDQTRHHKQTRAAKKAKA